VPAAKHEVSCHNNDKPFLISLILVVIGSAEPLVTFTDFR